MIQKQVEQMCTRWRFQWIDGLDQVLAADFGQQWQMLLARCHCATVFQEPVLVRAWLVSKGAALGARPNFCWAQSDCGEEVLSPFCLLPFGYRNSWQRRMIAVGEPHFDYQTPASTIQESQAAPWDSFWKLLAVELSRVHRCEHAMLLRVNASCAPVGTLEDASRESPRIAISRYTSLDELLSGRPQNHRTDVRRQMRRLRERGPVELTVYRRNESGAARYELQRLRIAYEKLWAGTPSSGLFDSPGTFEFYQQLIDTALSPGLVHFSVLLSNGRPISWHFGFLHRGVLHWYKPTYEKEFESFSPGKIHLAYLIELAIREGWKEIDLGCGTEPYKYHWTCDVRPLVQWQWHARTCRAAACRWIRRAVRKNS